MFAEDQLPVAIPHRDEITVIIEVVEVVTRALRALPVRIVQLVVAIQMVLERGVAALGLPAYEQAILHRRVSGGGEQSREPISPEKICRETSPALILPGQRTTAGTRKAPSQFEFFSLRNGVVAASGQEN